MHCEKTYCGRRSADGNTRVRVLLPPEPDAIERKGACHPLDPRYDLRNHSPTGFEWGYGGSGPAQLALALLADAMQDDEVALALYQPFKWRVIARLDRDEWRLTEREVRGHVEALRLGQPAE